MVAEITDANYHDLVEGSSTPVLIDFWATWCGPCRIYAPTVDRLAKVFKGKVRVVRVDVDDNPKLVDRFQIFEIPTTVLLVNGRQRKIWQGVQDYDDLHTYLQKVILSFTGSDRVSR